MLPLKERLVLLRAAQELESLQPHLESSLKHLALVARMQTEGRGKVEVHKGHVGDGELIGVACMYACSPWFSSADVGVGDD